MSPEEMSFRNLVEWNREELLRLIDGAKVYDVFTKCHHSHLVKYGVIRNVRKKHCSLPTPEAMKVLEDGERLDK